MNKHFNNLKCFFSFKFTKNVKISKYGINRIGFWVTQFTLFLIHKEKKAAQLRVEVIANSLNETFFAPEPSETPQPSNSRLFRKRQSRKPRSLSSSVHAKEGGEEVLNFPCLYLGGSLHAKIRTPFGSERPPTRDSFSSFSRAASLRIRDSSCFIFSCYHYCCVVARSRGVVGLLWRRAAVIKPDSGVIRLGCGDFSRASRNWSREEKPRGYFRRDCSRARI